MGTAKQIKKGDMVKFLGYDEMSEDMEELYKEGEVLEIVEYKGEDTYVTRNVDGVLDSLYPEEFEVGEGLEFVRKEKPKKKKAPVKKEEEEDAGEEAKPVKKATTKKPAAKKETKKAAPVKKAAKKPATEKAPAQKEELKAPIKAEVIEDPVMEVRDDGGGHQLSLLPIEPIIDMTVIDQKLKSGEERKEVAESVFKAVRTLANTVAYSYYQLGALLVYIRNNNLHKELGYPDTVKGFVQYCNEEGKTTEYITYDRAKNWIYIYDRAQSLKIDESRLSKIGWTKAMKLLRNSETAEDFEELSEVAAEGSREDLIEAINAKTSEKTKQPVQSKLFKFKLSGYKADTVEEVMNHYAKEYTDGDLTDFLYLLAVEFRDRHSSVDVNIDEHVDLFEKRFNVKVKGYESLGPIPSYGASLKKDKDEQAAKTEQSKEDQSKEESKAAPKKVKKAPAKKVVESKPVENLPVADDISLDDLFTE